MPKLGRQVAAEFQGRVSQVALVYDIVAIKHRPGFVARYVHGDAFRHPGTNQVAHSGASQIVKQQTLITPYVVPP
jgi:hypothetical protein